MGMGNHKKLAYLIHNMSTLLQKITLGLSSRDFLVLYYCISENEKSASHSYCKIAEFFGIFIIMRN
jgi:hypothetical protein